MNCFNFHHHSCAPALSLCSVRQEPGNIGGWPPDSDSHFHTSCLYTGILLAGWRRRIENLLTLHIFEINEQLYVLCLQAVYSVFHNHKEEQILFFPLSVDLLLSPLLCSSDQDSRWHRDNAWHIIFTLFIILCCLPMLSQGGTVFFLIFLNPTSAQLILHSDLGEHSKILSGGLKSWIILNPIYIMIFLRTHTYDEFNL